MWWSARYCRLPHLDLICSSRRSPPRKILPVYHGRIYKDVLYSGNMALYRTAIDEVGNFDECLGPGTHFPAAEDNDLGFRLLEAGYCIRYVPEAILYHHAWRSQSQVLQLRWAYARGQGAFYAKHLRMGDLYMLRRMLRHLRLQCLLVAGRLLRRNVDRPTLTRQMQLGWSMGLCSGPWFIAGAVTHEQAPPDQPAGIRREGYVMIVCVPGRRAGRDHSVPNS